MIVVSDTSPVRGLIAIGRTDLLQKLFHKVIIPDAVQQELSRIELLRDSIQLFLQQPWVEIKQIAASAEYNTLRKYLDKGESEAIILAKQLHADLLLMDENKGRQLAHGMNLKVLGLIGVLIKAKRSGLLNEIKPLLDELMNEHGFWIKSDFYQNILNAVGESK